MAYFPYGQTELQYLSHADPVLGAAITRIGPVKREIIPDLFSALLNSIAGQQISGKALATVWERLCTAVCPMTPARLLSTTEDTLRTCGIAGRKASYMRAAAEAFQNDAWQPETLPQLDDEAFIRQMTKLPGVGRWTAEMLLIFSLQRPDVLSYTDFGIRKGLCLLYHLPDISKTTFAMYRNQYAPYATVAGFYLWAVASGA